MRPTDHSRARLVGALSLTLALLAGPVSAMEITPDFRVPFNPDTAILGYFCCRSDGGERGR